MADWKTITLGELIDIKHGFAFKGEFFAEQGPGDILLTPGNFAIGGGFQWGKRKFYNGPVGAEYVLSPGEVVVTMTDLSKEADTIGYAALIPKCDQRILHNQRIGRVKLKGSRADARFLYWLMRTGSYRNEILASVTGSTVKHTSPSKILAFEFQLPPLDEQRAIASVLSALDDKIELNRRMNETLEQMAQAIFKDWFVDFGPVRRKQEGASDPIAIMGGLVQNATRAAELAALFPDALGDDGLPEGWAETSLGEAVTTLETGNRPKGGIRGIVEGVPSIGAENITGLARYDYSKTKYVPLEFFASMKRGVLGQRDVLIYKDGGRPGEFEPHISMFGLGFPYRACCINEHVYRAVACRPFSQEFLYLHLTSEASLDEMRKKGTGVAIPGLNSTATKSLRIVRPSNNVLDEFSIFMHPIFDRVFVAANESRTLAETRDYLLPKLMSGEVRVREAEKIAEDAL